MHRLPLILASAFVLAGCQSDKNPQRAAASPRVELLEHHEGKFTLLSTAGLDPSSTEFTLGDTRFSITQRWPHSESTRSTSDENPEVNHAIEISWTDQSGSPQTRWLHQSTEDDPATTLPAISTAIRILPPGARPQTPGDTPLQGLVQFICQDRHHDLPAAGGEVFPKWKLTSLKTYQHALLDEQGELIEDGDSNFTNRAIQANLRSDDGTEERHIAFIDHPELTRGIHPTILPAKRLRGEGASQSRLVVRPAMPSASEFHQILVTPSLHSQGLEVRTLAKDSETTSAPTVSQITDFPADIPLPDGTVLRLLRHFDHASAQVKWERRDRPATGIPSPALVIEHRPSHEERHEFVLIRDQTTPCRIGDDFLLLRYSDETSPAASE